MIAQTQSLLKERLVPAGGARRSLIKMHRLILTGSQTPNEAGSLGAPPHILRDEKIHYLGGAARRRWGVGVRGFSG